MINKLIKLSLEKIKIKHVHEAHAHILAYTHKHRDTYTIHTHITEIQTCYANFIGACKEREREFP